MACAEPGATADRGGEHEGIAGNHEPKSEASVGRMDVLEGREAEVADDLQSDRITLDASEVGRCVQASTSGHGAQCESSCTDRRVFK